MPGFNIGGGNQGSEPSITPPNDIHRSHRWRIISLGENSILRPSYVFAKDLQLPNYVVEEETVQGAAIKYKFAKAINWEDVTVTFYDVLGIYQDILNWQDKVYTSGNGIRQADNYKKTSSFILTDGAGSNVGVTFTLKNSWPKSVSHSPLSYESSDFKLITLTLSYDWAEMGTASG